MIDARTVLDVAPQTWIHLASIVPALVLGIVQVALPKGTPAHRRIGRLWAASMLVASLSSFWIQRHGLSWIHGLSIVTMVSVVFGLIFARRGQFRLHASSMLGAFVGALGAGVGALAPGRLLHAVLFGT